MRSKSNLRTFTLQDFDALDHFFRFNPAYLDACVVKQDMFHFDSYKRLCQIVGHWTLNGYGWYGLFDENSDELLGIVGAEYNQYIRNAEFTLISSDVTAKNRLTWMLMFRYMCLGDWQKFGVDTYAVIESNNHPCVRLVEKSGAKFIKESHYAEGSKGKLYKIDWDKGYERFKGFKVFNGT